MQMFINDRHYLCYICERIYLTEDAVDIHNYTRKYSDITG